MSTILLAKELGANPVLLDDYGARKMAKSEGLGILESIGFAVSGLIIGSMFLDRTPQNLPAGSQV